MFGIGLSLEYSYIHPPSSDHLAFISVYYFRLVSAILNLIYPYFGFIILHFELRICILYIWSRSFRHLGFYPHRFWYDIFYFGIGIRHFWISDNVGNAILDLVSSNLELASPIFCLVSTILIWYPAFWISDQEVSISVEFLDFFLHFEFMITFFMLAPLVRSSQLNPTGEHSTADT